MTMILMHKNGGNGATDGARTHDHSDHNRGLYQLSYSRHIRDFRGSVIHDLRRFVKQLSTLGKKTCAMQ
jgi:hypothetical protein